MVISHKIILIINKSHLFGFDGYYMVFIMIEINYQY